MSKGGEKGESVGAKDTPSIADYYSSVTGNAGLSEGKASGGKSSTGGAPAASTASSAGRGGPSSADVGKGGVSVGAKGMGGEGPSGMPAIGAPSVGRSATMGGPGIGTTPTVMGSDRAPSRGGFGAYMGSARQAEARSMDALSYPTSRGLYGYTPAPSARQAESASMRALPGYVADTVVTDSLIDRIIGVESRGRAAAKNPNSSATGAGQFIASTWLDMIDKHRPDLARGRTEREILALRLDPELSRQMTKQYARDNVEQIAEKHPHLTAGSAYLAHFLGPATAERVIGANRNEPIANYVSQLEVNSNRSILGGNKTVGDIIDWAERKMTAPAATATVDLPAAGPVPAWAPADRPGGLMPGNVEWEQDRRGLAVLAPPTGSPWDNLSPAAQQALSMLSTQRDQVALTSAARSGEGNRDAKGTRDSEHLTGNAFDISLRDMTDQEKSLVVEQAIMSGATRVGTYGVTDPSHVPVLHVDFADTGKTGVHAMFDGSSRNVDKAPGWFTTGLSQVTSPQPSARPDSAAPTSGGFGRFMGDAVQFGPSPRSLEGPGGIYLDAPPSQQPNMTTPPMGFSGGQTPRGQDDAPASRQTAFGPSPRSMEGPGGIMLDYVPDTARPSRPDQFEAQPERDGKAGGKADIDPGQERRDRYADRIDEALPWIAGPIAGAINESRAKSGKTTFGDWLSDLLDGKGGSSAVYAPEGSGEGVSVVTPIAAATPTPPTTGPSQWLLDILDEPKRPTPREKWGRGLMPTA